MTASPDLCTRLRKASRIVRRAWLLFLVAAISAMGLAVTAPAVRTDAATATEVRAFITRMAPGARESMSTYGVPASVTIAQAALESGWGTSKLAVTYNNYFGIKCGRGMLPTKCTPPLDTYEYNADGTRYLIKAQFQRYDSVGESMRDHGWYLVNRGIYTEAFQYSTNPRKFAQAIADAGYATDPGYARYLHSMMASYNLFQYDMGNVITDPVAPKASTSPKTAQVGSVPAETPTSESEITSGPSAAPTTVTNLRRKPTWLQSMRQECRPAAQMKLPTLQPGQKLGMALCSSPTGSPR